MSSSIPCVIPTVIPSVSSSRLTRTGAAAPLIVRPSAGKEKAEVFDKSTIGYMNELRGKRKHTFTELLGGKIDKAFENAPVVQSSTWTVKAPKRKPKAVKKSPDFPVLSGSGPVRVIAPNTEWGAGMVTITKKSNQERQDLSEKRSEFVEKEEAYIKEIENLKWQLKDRERILDEMDREIFDLHKELEYYRN